MQISIRSVQYGAGQPGAGQTGEGQIGAGRTNCSGSAVSPIRRVEAECQGQQRCSLLVTASNLLPHSAPCPAPPPGARQLAVSWQCRPSSLRTAVTCPGGALGLSCARAGELLLVVSSLLVPHPATLHHYCGPDPGGRAGACTGTLHVTLSSIQSTIFNHH